MKKSPWPVELCSRPGIAPQGARFSCYFERIILGVSLPVIYQRIEGVAVFICSIWLYFWLDYKWYWLVIFILAFDAFMVGYLFNARLGAHTYNIGHSLTLPVLLAASSAVFGWHWSLAAGLIWLAHIGMDRALGYGLKEKTGFKHTHLGRL
jgi:hypothetical protein